MSDSFVKIYNSILDSSIWLEDYATKIVWITMLAMAHEDGIVRASVGGLAHRANVKREECEAAIEKLLAPDPDSKSKEHDGRRIEQADGGWLVINHRKYRDLRTPKQISVSERVRKHRENKENKLHETQCNDVTPEAEAEAEAEAYTSTSTSLRSVDVCSEPSGSPPAHRLPLNDKTLYDIHYPKIAELKELYPAVDVEQQLRNMRGWLDANPDRRKTRRGIMGFVHRWLAKEQDGAKPTAIVQQRKGDMARLAEAFHNFDVARGKT